VFLVNLVQEKFPSRRRREALELPVALMMDALPAGDYHLHEERRLFYVGMTRARRELYLSSASDYGGSRQRKVSLFVLEANANPNLSAEEDFADSALAIGITYDDLLARILAIGLSYQAAWREA